MSLTLDTRQFEEALREYQEATGKDMAVVLNRAALNLAYRAAENTPKATPAQARAGLYSDPHLRYALTSLSLKKRGVTGLKKGDFGREVEALTKRRIGGTRYLRQMWRKAVEKLGGSWRGGAEQPERGASGDATKATASMTEMFAEIIGELKEPLPRLADSAEEVGMKALQAGIDYVAVDMINHAQDLMSGTAKKYSK